MPRKGASDVRTLAEVLGREAAADRLGVSVSTLDRWKRAGPPKTRREEPARVTLTESERMAYEARKSHKIARNQHRLEAPRDAVGFGKTGRKETERYRGVTSNRRVGKILNERTSEVIIHKIMTQAAKVSGKKRKGRFFVTFGLVEFGKTVGSGGKRLRSVSKGPMGGYSAYQTYASTDPNYGVVRRHGATDLATLETQVRKLVSELSDNPKGSAVLDSFTVKRYEQKTEEEREAWVKERSRRK